MEIFLILISVLLMIPGIIAIAFMLPGIPYLFLVALIYGFIDHFSHLTLKETAILAGLAIFSIIVDQSAGLLGARFGGARGKTFLYGIGGAFIGTLIFPLFGGFIGLFLGTLTGELIRTRRHDHAIKAATIGIIGTLTGIIINIIVAIAFVGLFIYFVI